jgi:hypothetical protein
VQPQLLPREDLEELVEGAEAPREDREGVGQAAHLLLPLVHRARHDLPRDPLVGQLLRGEEGGDDPRHLSAARQDRVGQHPHQPDGAAAEHQVDPLLRHAGAQGPGLLAERLGEVVARAAEHAEAPEIHAIKNRGIPGKRKGIFRA